MHDPGLTPPDDTVITRQPLAHGAASRRLPLFARNSSRAHDRSGPGAIVFSPCHGLGRDLPFLSHGHLRASSDSLGSRENRAASCYVADHHARRRPQPGAPTENYVNKPCNKIGKFSLKCRAQSCPANPRAARRCRRLDLETRRHSQRSRLETCVSSPRGYAWTTARAWLLSSASRSIAASPEGQGEFYVFVDAEASDLVGPRRGAPRCESPSRVGRVVGFVRCERRYFSRSYRGSFASRAGAQGPLLRGCSWAPAIARPWNRANAFVAERGDPARLS